jgi:hypothetical protein
MAIFSSKSFVAGSMIKNIKMRQNVRARYGRRLSGEVTRRRLV